MRRAKQKNSLVSHSSTRPPDVPNVATLFTPAIDALQGRLALSMQETADSVGVSLKTVSNWIDSGKLRAKKIDGRVLVPLAAILELLGDPICGLVSRVNDIAETERRAGEVTAKLAALDDDKSRHIRSEGR